MSAGLRTAILAVFGALWASGVTWLVLHYFCSRPSDFGPEPHPWVPAVLRIHGWIAVTSVFLLGWIASQHVSERWPQGIKRASGLAMASVAAVLALSGYALYYTGDRLHELASALHQLVGAAAIAFALTHWRRYRAARRVLRNRRTSRTPA